MVGIAFGRVHYIFNLVQQLWRHEVRMVADQIIDVAFHHVFAIRIALPAYAVYFIMNVANSVFQIARDVIPHGIGDDHVMRRNVLVGLHVIYHAANVGIELLLYGLYHFTGQVQPFRHVHLGYKLIDV